MDNHRDHPTALHANANAILHMNLTAFLNRRAAPLRRSPASAVPTLLMAAGVALAAAGQPTTAQASVRVHGEATSSGPTISVQVFADISSPAVISHSFRLFYPASLLQVEAAVRNSAVWSFTDGSRPVAYAGPDTSTPGQVLFVGGHFDAANPRGGVLGDRVLLGTVVFRRTTQDTPGFDLSIGRTGQFASFVAVDGSILEAVPGAVSIQSVKPNDADQDLDGLSDLWEEKNFGSTKEVFYSDDPDKDGVNNLSEEVMGSDPNDPASFLRLDIQGGREKLVLEWASAEERIYTIEAGKELGRFRPILEGITATPPLNSITLDPAEFGDQLFFRIRVDRPARR